MSTPQTTLDAPRPDHGDLTGIWPRSYGRPHARHPDAGGERRTGATRCGATLRHFLLTDWRPEHRDACDRCRVLTRMDGDA